MANITCPVCASIISDSNDRCPICGTELEKNKKPSQNNNFTNKTHFNESIPYRNEDLPPSGYSPEQINQQFAPPVKVTTEKSGKAKSFIIVAVIAFAIIFSVFIAILVSAFGSSDTVGMSKEIENIINKNVQTVDVPSIPEDKLKIENNIVGNKNIFINDDFVVFHLKSDEAIDLGDNDFDFYTRHFYVYCNKPSDNAEFNCNNYGADLEDDGYFFNVDIRSNYKNRYSEFEYIEEDDEFRKLNNYAIDNIEFETYYLEETYGSYAYYLISKPIDKDEHYLSIRIVGDKESEYGLIDFKDVFKYVITQKETEN